MVLRPLLWSFAVTSEPPFASDPVETYGARFLVFLLIAGVALILFNLVRYRGRTPGSAAWSLLFLGVIILPAITTMFGTLLVFERGETVEFCGSCHKAMKTFVDDMHNPNSQSLAAIHYRNAYIPRNQCYTCHTSFGLFGTMEAKLGGILQVHRYYTGTFRRPLSMRTPYQNDDCLKCHAGSVKWSTNHADNKDAIFAGKIRCIDCHSQDHPPHNQGKTL